MSDYQDDDENKYNFGLEPRGPNDIQIKMIPQARGEYFRDLAALIIGVILLPAQGIGVIGILIGLCFLFHSKYLP